MWNHISIEEDDTVWTLIEAAEKVRDSMPEKTHFLLVLRSDGRADIDERKRECRTSAIARGFPVFDELTNAAKALQAIAHHEKFQAKQNRAGDQQNI